MLFQLRWNAVLHEIRDVVYKQSSLRTAEENTATSFSQQTCEVCLLSSLVKDHVISTRTSTDEIFIPGCDTV
jgi:hypothetical protein